MSTVKNSQCVFMLGWAPRNLNLDGMDGQGFYWRTGNTYISDVLWSFCCHEKRRLEVSFSKII